MSPQASKNVRVFGYFLIGIVVVLAVMIPMTYYMEKNHFETSQKVMSEVISYGQATHTRGGAQNTQFLTVRFTDPVTNESKTVATTLVAYNTLDSDNDAKMERKKSLLPVGAVTTSFYHPASERITIASELPNGELIKPGATIPFLVKLLIPFVLVGTLLVFVGRKR